MKSQPVNDWGPLLEEEFSKPYFNNLMAFLDHEYSHRKIYPDRENIFNALTLTPFSKVKAVILGQDPYHGPKQAHGLSFSVQGDVALPPSLKNIFKELQTDIGCEIPKRGNLEKWAREGVLLLNTVLTVREGEANSHKGKGWETFTDRIIELLNEKENPVIYILWGSSAQSKKGLIDTSKHFIIQSPHPSPLSAYRGFFGSRPFSKTNDLLNKIGLEAIDWELSQ